MKVALLAGIRQEYLVKFLPQLEVVPLDQNPDAIFVRSDQLDGKHIPPSVFAVCRAGTGVDNIPLDWCSENGVVVFNAPGANANSVKELVIWALIAASRHLPSALKLTEERKYWEREDVESLRYLFTGNEIRGKSILLIGAGKIGKLLIESLAFLGMNVYAFDPFVSKDEILPAIKVEPLGDAPQCDFVSLHCESNEKTRGMIGDFFLSRAKRGVTILNFARPELVDNTALDSALRDGRVAFYFTDFHDRSLHMHFPERVVTLPHLGALTKEAEKGAQEIVAGQFADFWTTGAIKNSVNFPNCSMPKRNGGARVIAANFNVPTMIARITEILGAAGYNISQMLNMSRGGVGYNIIDIDNPNENLTQIVENISRLEGVTKARLIL